MTLDHAAAEKTMHNTYDDCVIRDELDFYFLLSLLKAINIYIQYICINKYKYKSY